MNVTLNALVARLFPPPPEIQGALIAFGLMAVCWALIHYNIIP